MSTPGVPEPATARGRAAVARIVEAASNLFLRQGVAATGMEQVGAASGTGKGQLYHYFAGKEALVSRVIAHDSEEIVNEQIALLTGGWDGVDRWLECLFQAHVDASDPRRCPLGSIAIGLPDRSASVQDALNDAFGQWLNAIASALRELQESGQLAADADVRALASAALAAYQGGLVLSEAQGTAAPLRAALDGVRMMLEHNRR
jgi:TetR/AcrR family transcriptional repressor of nem operon